MSNIYINSSKNAQLMNWSLRVMDYPNTWNNRVGCIGAVSIGEFSKQPAITSKVYHMTRAVFCTFLHHALIYPLATISNITSYLSLYTYDKVFINKTLEEFKEKVYDYQGDKYKFSSNPLFLNEVSLSFENKICYLPLDIFLSCVTLLTLKLLVRKQDFKYIRNFHLTSLMGQVLFQGVRSINLKQQNPEFDYTPPRSHEIDLLNNYLSIGLNDLEATQEQVDKFKRRLEEIDTHSQTYLNAGKPALLGVYFKLGVHLNYIYEYINNSSNSDENNKILKNLIESCDYCENNTAAIAFQEAIKIMAKKEASNSPSDLEAKKVIVRKTIEVALFEHRIRLLNEITYELFTDDFTSKTEMPEALLHYQHQFDVIMGQPTTSLNVDGTVGYRYSDAKIFAILAEFKHRYKPIEYAISLVNSEDTKFYFDLICDNLLTLDQRLDPAFDEENPHQEVKENSITKDKDVFFKESELIKLLQNVELFTICE